MVFSNNLLFGLGGQTPGPATFDSTLIGNSVWFDGSADYMDKTFSSGSAQSRIVYACWLQRNDFTRLQSIFTANKGGRADRFGFQADDTIDIHLEQSGGSTIIYSTSNVFRDTGWYHFILSIDLNVIQANAVQLYVNGVPNNVTVTFGPSAGALSTMDSFGNSGIHAIGKRGGASDRFSNTYQTQCTFLVGQSIQNGDVAVTDFLDTFTFGTNGSQFIPKSDANIAALASTAGGNSFCLDFANSSDLGNDISSNNNDFTPSSMTAANQSTSTPSLTFSTYNILDANPAYTSTNDGANTYVVTNVAGAGIRATLPMTSGKWYWEQRNTYNEAGPAISAGAGFVNLATNSIIGEGSGSHSCYLDLNGTVRINASTGSSIGITNGSTAVMGVAFDADTGKVWFRDSSGFGSSGDPANGTNAHATLATTSAPFFIASRVGGSIPEPFLNAGGNPTFNGLETAGGNADANGRGNFKLGAVPTGFLSLNTANLSAPTYQGIDYFAPTLYEGNGEGQRVGDFVPFTDVGTITKSFLSDGGTNTGTTDLRIANSVSTSPTNVQVKTLSVWIKPCSIREQFIYIGNGTSDNSERLYTSSTGAVQYLTRNGGSSPASVTTAGNLVNDTSQWVHLVYALDYRDGTTEADRVKLYVNGIRQTTTGTQPANNMTAQAYINKASTEQIIGTHPDFTTAGNRMDAYLAEMYMVDGTVLDPSTFGVLDTSTNKWLPKSPTTIKAAVTFGNCGFYLDFLDGSDFGDDDSGNNRDFTDSATIGTENQFTDTPSNNVFTFATDGTGTISEGNTRVDLNDSVYGLRPTVANFSSTGKFYGEFLVNAVSGSTVGIGFARDIASQDTTNPSTTPNNDSKNFLLQLSDGNKINGDSTGVSYGSGISAGQTVMWAFDAATRKIWFGSEGTFFASGDPAAGTNEAFTISGTGTVTLVTYDGSNARTANLTMRNATAAFEHTAPTGFTPFTQDNLDDTASKITAFAWIKNRDATDNHMLFDRVRGVGNDLHSNDPAAQVFNANTVQRFLQRGVQIGSDVEVNTANESYVLWQWLLGDSATTGSTNTDGSVNTTVIAADAEHFSIVTGTTGGSGATFGHGLGAAPDLILNKNLNNTDGWLVYSSAFDSADNYMQLNATNSVFTGSTVWGTDATSTVFTLGSFFVNVECIAYCFRSVPGVCKVGSYTGNGDGATATGYNGPYIELGFKPSFILLKRIDAANSWILQDTVRHTLNPVDNYLQAESTSAETATTGNVDFLSSGLKIRTGNGNAWNASGGKYIYLAMADIGGNGTLPPVYGR